MRFFLIAAALALAACGSDSDESSFPGPANEERGSSSGSAPTPPGDAGAGGGSSGGGFSGEGDTLPTSCEGACRESSLVLKKGELTVDFDRTQFGFDRTTSYPKLKLSAYQGGADACPAPDDEPNHALQISGVPAPFDDSTFEAAAGLTAALYDFRGGVIAGSTAVLKGTRIQLTPVAASLDSQAAELFVAFDVHLEFEQGITVDGHVFSTHCPSIDQR